MTEHSIDVLLETDTAQILIEDRLLVSGRDSFRFRLAPWLSIESLLLDGRRVTARRQGPEYLVELPADAQHELRFRLRGVVPARDSHEAILPGVYSSSGSDGFFLPGYDAWIPWNETGRVSYRLTITVPSGQRAVATGKLVSDQDIDAGYEAEFASIVPGEPPSLFVGPYHVQEKLSGGLRLRTYFHQELTPLSASGPAFE